jgi:hypothetical protein
MLPVNPLPVLQIPTGIGMLLGGLALGAFIALVVGFVVHRRDQSAPTIDVANEVPETGSEPAADKPSRARVSA